MIKPIYTLDGYLEWHSENIQNNKDEVLTNLFGQVKDLVVSIKVLLKKGLFAQCIILNRTLGEVSIFIFVICSLNKNARKGYCAIYELHGLLEMEDILEKSKHKHYKKDKSYNIFKKRIKKLTNIVIKEFGEDGEEPEDDKIRKFVRDKLSKYIYDDAKILLEQRYSDVPIVGKLADDILKGGVGYQIESNFIHGRYISFLPKKFDLKKIIISGILKRINLVIGVYSIMK